MINVKQMLTEVEQLRKEAMAFKEVAAYCRPRERVTTFYEKTVTNYLNEIKGEKKNIISTIVWS